MPLLFKAILLKSLVRLMTIAIEKEERIMEGAEIAGLGQVR